jgi:thiamine-monophosphate kinase
MKRKLARQKPTRLPPLSPTYKPSSLFPKVARRDELSCNAKYSQLLTAKKQRLRNKNRGPNRVKISLGASPGCNSRKSFEMSIPTDKKETKTENGTAKITKSIIPAANRTQNPAGRIARTPEELLAPAPISPPICVLLYCRKGMVMPRASQTENSLLAEISRAFCSSNAGKSSRTVARTASRLSLGIGDDAALFRPTSGCETILTCDWFLEGTHFLRDKHPADAVGWKCLARAVSDIAAMGGAPRCFLLSLALPESATGSWLAEFLRGLRQAARQFNCVLAGGDTTKRDQILINITVVGEVPRGRALRRDGARAGDVLVVSGRLGEAERGLHLLRKLRGVSHRAIVNRPTVTDRADLNRHNLSRNLDPNRDPNDSPLRKHLYPEPRLALGQWLVAKRLATAAIDLSDGLSSDLARLCTASGVGARVDAGKLPVVNVPASPRHGRHQSANASKIAPRDEPLMLALHGGDDYELLFTVPKRKEMQIPPAFAGVPLISIGEITASRKILLVGQNSRSTVLEPGGWDPFRKRK